jgi:hypothetical protein
LIKKFGSTIRAISGINIVTLNISKMDVNANKEIKIYNEKGW